MKYYHLDLNSTFFICADGVRLAFLLPGAVGTQMVPLLHLLLRIRRLILRRLHMVTNRLVDQRTDERVQRDGGEEQGGALHPVDGQHKGDQVGQEDRTQARDRPRESRRPTTLLLEVRVDRQRGSGYTDAHAEA